MVFALRVDFKGEYNNTARCSEQYHCSLVNNITTSETSNITPPINQNLFAFEADAHGEPLRKFVRILYDKLGFIGVFALHQSGCFVHFFKSGALRTAAPAA